MAVRWSYAKTERWIAISPQYAIEIARSISVTPYQGEHITTPFILCIYRSGAKVHESKHDSIDGAQRVAERIIRVAEQLSIRRLLTDDNIRDIDGWEPVK